VIVHRDDGRYAHIPHCNERCDENGHWLEQPVPAMLWVAGVRFACKRCHASVFTRSGDVFACNGCGALYSSNGDGGTGA
jgi:hypothetical protein